MKSLVKSKNDSSKVKFNKIRKRFQVSSLESVFSYSVKKKTDIVIITQVETECSVLLKMEHLDKTLRITQFKIIHNTQLKYLSPDLNEAALLEIIVQALVILFQYAREYDVDEIFLFLSPADASHLKNYRSFFDEVVSLNTRAGKKITFTVYNTPETRRFLAKRVKVMKIKLKQELWKCQKMDFFVRNYLQSHQRGVPLPLEFRG